MQIATNSLVGLIAPTEALAFILWVVFMLLWAQHWSLMVCFSLKVDVAVFKPYFKEMVSDVKPD